MRSADQAALTIVALAVTAAADDVAWYAPVVNWVAPACAVPSDVNGASPVGVPPANPLLTAKTAISAACASGPVETVTVVPDPEFAAAWSTPPAPGQPIA